MKGLNFNRAAMTIHKTSGDEEAVKFLVARGRTPDEARTYMDRLLASKVEGHPAPEDSEDLKKEEDGSEDASNDDTPKDEMDSNSDE